MALPKNKFFLILFICLVFFSKTFSKRFILFRLKSKKNLLLAHKAHHDLLHAVAKPRITIDDFGTGANHVGQFTDNKVNALLRRLFQSLDLLLYDRLECHVGREKADPKFAYVKDNLIVIIHYSLMINDFTN